MNVSGLLRLLLALQLALVTVATSAHENLPASLMLQEQSLQVFDVRWRIPQTQGSAPDIQPVFPADCAVLLPSAELVSPGARLQTWQIRCDKGLRNSASIAFTGLSLAIVDVVVRVQYQDGSSASRIARARTPQVELGQASVQISAIERTVGSYFGLGVDHILSGLDHLLFVLCLLILMPKLRAMVKTITAFTLAHSITLALAALQVVHVPQPPVEAAIALSILFLARELACKHRHNRNTRESGAVISMQRLWAVAFVFGLLHGFGFAGALAEVGLPQGDIPAALLLFNLGVETGQLLFVAVVLGLGVMLRRLRQFWPQLWPHWAAPLPIYAVGAMSGFWWLQRMIPVLGLRNF